MEEPEYKSQFPLGNKRNNKNDRRKESLIEEPTSGLIFAWLKAALTNALLRRWRSFCGKRRLTAKETTKNHGIIIGKLLFSLPRFFEASFLCLPDSPWNKNGTLSQLQQQPVFKW